MKLHVVAAWRGGGDVAKTFYSLDLWTLRE